MPAEEELQVSTLELFFDLVFVFTLSPHLLAGDLTAATLAMVVLIFDVLFWIYAAYAWLTSMAPPDRPARRLLLMVGMAGFLFCALAVPRAFDSGGVAFGATAPRWTWTAPAACASSTGWCSRSISDLSTRQPRWPTTSPNGGPATEAPRNSGHPHEA